MKPDNLVALHHQMTGSYVVDAPPLVTQPLDWWALNLIEGLQRDRERLMKALRDVTENLEHARMMVPDAQVSSMLFDSTQEARGLLTELEANDAGIRGEDGK